VRVFVFDVSLHKYTTPLTLRFYFSSAERVQKKIRNSEIQKIPLTAVVGPAEAEGNSLAMRARCVGEGCRERERDGAGRQGGREREREGWEREKKGHEKCVGDKEREVGEGGRERQKEKVRNAQSFGLRRLRGTLWRCGRGVWERERERWEKERERERQTHRCGACGG